MNVKNILFDLDNTLIENQEDNILWYKKALSNLGYDENDYMDIYNAIDEYTFTLSEENNFYSKQSMLNFINTSLGKNYSIELIDELNKYIAKYWTNHPFISEKTLQYLSSKYNLYIFTNWFKDAQAGRLENIGVLKYFKKVFSPEYYGAKPFKSTFGNVLSTLNCKADECVMIGDSKYDDIFGARNVGMNAILFNYNGCRDNPDIMVDNYIVINDLKQLEFLL